MLKFRLILLPLLFMCVLQAQEVTLPVDLRQHNLTDNDLGIFNPAFSINNENTHSIGLWTRWQWQTIDGDPTTFFLGYSGKLNSKSSVGVGFFQHNTGVFLNTGGVLNYAYEFRLNDRARLAVGLNMFGYQQKLADDRFQNGSQIQLPQFQTTNDFILQFAPGIQFYYDRFSIGFTSENMFDYSVTESERYSDPGDRIFLGTVAYDFPVSIINSDDGSVIRPMLYIKSVPGSDTQVGLSTLLSTDKFWGQLGYNSFYGISVGGGGKFFKRWALGALVEFGTDSSLKDYDPTFELVTAFDFGTKEPRKKIPEIEEEKEKEEELIAEENRVEQELTKAEALAAKKQAREEERLERQRIKDSVALAKKEEAIAANLRREEKRKIDSLDRAKQKEADALAKQISRQKRLDSIAMVREQREIANAERRREQMKRDSIEKAAAAQALAEARQKDRQRITDSIAKAKLAAEEAGKQAQIAQQIEEDKPKAGEKYEEVKGEDGLTPGYYLIANVFGTKRYFDAFMSDLTKKGLRPKSFFRSLNKYNYVYLERYNTMGEARRARDNKFNGRYPDKTWIYRVVGE